MKNNKDIVWFQDVGKDDVGLVGGKGANLGEMTQAGVPVPPGFIVTAGAYFRFLDTSGLRPKIEKMLAGLDHRNNDALQKASQQIKQAIIDTPMPEELARQIRDAYRKLSMPATEKLRELSDLIKKDIAERYIPPDDGREILKKLDDIRGFLVAVRPSPAAVRSSATAEDLPQASFAGQQATFLNVSGEEHVVAAVKACWASLFEARAIFYRVENGFEHMKVGIAVPVQNMVQSERSGVIFTVEPVSSDDTKIVIEAVCGLGEAIVSGEVTPDLYVVDKKSLQILERRVATQEQQLVRDDRGKGGELGGNVWVKVSPALGEAGNSPTMRS